MTTVSGLIYPIGLSQRIVSHHLKVLTGAGFLSRSKRGTWAYHRLIPEALEEVSGLLCPLSSGRFSRRCIRGRSR
ncbi:MAG: ArsR family transcriptional regulator [Microbacterium sp.]|uniref:ArsR/SmtB family transcription factor n=1 Tax=Microbacterium sp. TaxID=51671 RepID=UPI002721932F|nr:ArsR family transcriptional regulator [Microbacterium sp.]MDO8382334.1 ArsR family transcriptional regulator [Microbacterium sp.]